LYIGDRRAQNQQVRAWGGVEVAAADDPVSMPVRLHASRVNQIGLPPKLDSQNSPPKFMSPSDPGHNGRRQGAGRRSLPTLTTI